MDTLKKALVVLILLGVVGVLFWTNLRGDGLEAIEHFPTIGTQEQFQRQVLDEPGVVLVDIYTERCSYCRQLAPELAELEKRYEGRVKFVKLDADKAKGLAAMHRIRGVPTMAVYAGGEHVDQFDGYKPADAIAVRLDLALQEQSGQTQ